MVKKLFSLSEKGYKDVISAILLTAFYNITVLIPTLLLFGLIYTMLQNREGSAQEPSLFSFWGIALILLLVIFIVYQAVYKKTYMAAYEESANTRTALAEKLRGLPLSYFGKKDSSDLTSTLMDDTAIQEQTLSSSVPPLFGGILSSLMIIIFLFFINWKLSLSLFICLPIALLILLVSYKISNSVNWKNRNAKLAVSDGIQEYLENMKLLHTSINMESYRSKLESKIQRIVRTSMLYEVVMGIFISFAYNSLRIGMGLVVITGVSLIQSGELSVYTLLLFLFISAQIYDPLTDIIYKTGEFYYALVSASRIKEVETYPPQKGNKDTVLKHYDIHFDHVSFSYNKSKQVLHHVSFVAKQGQTTALVGPSGCGKSTLTKLACRFWDVQKGKVMIDGVDINTVDPENLLTYFSIVFQDVVLFNDTIYNNIKIGKQNATEEEIIWAAKMARCEDFINELPDGYETVIGENGKTLSGGERQRISIARAFLKDAPIILLDESTASLDPENETKIQEAISQLVKNKTVLMIAHRLRSIEGCDQIVVLDEGSIQEIGDHEELMENKGLYHRMFELQRESSEWKLAK